MKHYYEYLSELDNKSLMRGLIKCGLFNYKLPSILNSAPFYNYIKSKIKPFSDFTKKKKWKEWIRFESNRYNNLPRIIGIPNPIAYYFLCKTIIDNWSSIVSYFKNLTEAQTFKHSRIHVRQIKEKESIFEMNYDFQKSFGGNVPYDVIKTKYIVKTDISKFFDSIYSHSIPWALIGKENAKNNKDLSFYGNTIDHYLESMKYGETHGIITGPVASNIISELILCKIDYELSKKFKYVRNIDDYECYVESIDDGNKFINTLRTELAKFDLSINSAKTKIIPIAEYNKNGFVNDLVLIDSVLNYKSYTKSEASPDGSVTYRQLSSYFDLLNEIYNKYDQDGRVFLYAFKIINSKDLSIRASEYFVNKSMNLSLLCPYLLPDLENQVFKVYG